MADIHIACACDEEFLPHTATMLSSLLDNHGPVACIHLLHGGINGRRVARLKRFVSKYGSPLEDYTINTELLKSLKVDKHASVANYFRLLIPDVLPNNLTKILYLDSDIIVRKSLNHLWHTNIDAYPLAAVEDPSFTDHKRLGISLGSKYFNSGVLLINLTEFRRDGIHYQAIDFIQHNPDRIEYWDQDGLNAILADRWLELPLTWNAQHTLFFDQCFNVRYADVIVDPSIVHFSGDSLKPWCYNTQHPFKTEYELYRKKTPWRRYKPDGLSTFLSRVRKRVKERTKNQISALVTNDSLWRLIRNAIRVSAFIQAERDKEVSRRNQYSVLREIERLVPDMTVTAGPFRGLQYPRIESVGSTIAPKLLGTYEAELHGIVEEICVRGYSTIINIGCAEGYYAVGLAKRIPRVRVFAYDIDPIARELCRDMAEMNGVSERVIIGDKFEINNIEIDDCLGNRLIVCDCEGCEKYIFHKNVKGWPLICSSDLIVEIHEFIYSGISEYIHDLFCETHHVKVVRSLDDLLRPRTYESDLIKHCNLNTKIRLMAELRPCTMEWFYMKPKSSGLDAMKST